MQDKFCVAQIFLLVKIQPISHILIVGWTKCFRGSFRLRNLYFRQSSIGRQSLLVAVDEKLVTPCKMFGNGRRSRIAPKNAPSENRRVLPHGILPTVSTVKVLGVAIISGACHITHTVLQTVIFSPNLRVHKYFG